MRYVVSAVAVALAAAAVLMLFDSTRNEAPAPDVALPVAAAATSSTVAARPTPAVFAEPSPAVITESTAPALAEVTLPPALAPAYRLRPPPVKTDLTEAASDDTGSQGAADAAQAPLPLKAIPAPPPGPDPAPNPAVRDPNAVYKGEGARDDDGG